MRINTIADEWCGDCGISNDDVGDDKLKTSDSKNIVCFKKFAVAVLISTLTDLIQEEYLC